MSLDIDIDPHGMIRQPFAEVRARLLAFGQIFTERDLRLLPYNEISLAAMANAGKTACTLQQVIEEKRRRRYRFLHLSPDELDKAKRYIQVEGMYSDLCAQQQMRVAPRWSTLSARAKLWFKLNCLYTHSDAPEQRLRETYPLVLECEQRGYLKPENAQRIVGTLDSVSWLYPDAMDVEVFHTTLGRLTEEVLGYLDDTDMVNCQRELIADYSCTSNCYHATGPNGLWYP